MDDVREIPLSFTIPLLCGRDYIPSIPVSSPVFQLLNNIDNTIANSSNKNELYYTLQLLITENPINISRLSPNYGGKLIKEINTTDPSTLHTLFGLLEQLLRSTLTSSNFVELINMYIEDNKHADLILTLLQSLSRCGGPERYYAFPGFLTCLQTKIVIGEYDNWGISFSFRCKGNGVLFHVETSSMNMSIIVKNQSLFIEFGTNLSTLTPSSTETELKDLEIKVIPSRWHSFSLTHSKREQRIVIEMEKDSGLVSLSYPKQEEEGTLSVGGIAGDSKSYFYGEITDVLLLPTETLLTYGNDLITKENTIFKCYYVTNFAPIVVVNKETISGIVTRAGGINKMIVLLNPKINPRAFHDCPQILDLLYRLLSTNKDLRKEAFLHDEISLVFQSLISLCEMSQQPTFDSSQLPSNSVTKEYILFALRLLSSNLFSTIRNHILRRLFDIRWWSSDTLRGEYVKQLMINAPQQTLEMFNFKLFEKVAYRSMLLWFLHDEIPISSSQNIPQSHLVWRCSYIQYISTLILSDPLIVQYFMIDSLHLLNDSIETNNTKIQSLLMYMYLCLIIYSTGDSRLFVEGVLRRNKSMFLHIFCTQNHSFLKGNVQRLISFLKLDNGFGFVVDALCSTRLNALLYQISIECSFGLIKNTFVENPTSGYLSSKIFIKSMMNYTQRKNYISSFLVALSIQIKSNFFENKVVLDVVLNDLIRCGNEHVIWNSIINEKDWITTFNDISVSLVNEKEIEMLERSQKVFARLIGFAFTTTTYISLETVICSLLSKMKQQEKFFIIFRSLLNHIVFDVLSTLSTETLANIIPQLLLLFSYFFCKCNSYGCDSSLPFFQNDFKLISKCLDHYIPQSKPCDSQVSSMQHVFSVHLILCHLHSLTLNKSPVQLIRKTIQLLPPYFVEKPSYQGYNSWVIFHLKDIVEESADSNVRRDVANMLHLLDSSRKIPTTLDYKGIQTFGKLIESLYTTHQNGLKMQSDCVDVESKKSKPLFKSTFHQIQIPNIGVAQMDYPRLIISETDFILRVSTSTKKNYNMSLRSNPLFKIKQEPFQAFSGISFSDIKPFGIIKKTEQHDVNVLDPVKGFDEEYEQVSKKSKGLVDFMTLPHDQSFDCVIMKCAKRKIAKVYINPNNLQLCIKTQNKMIEFDLHLLETVIKRKQDIFELYVKMKHPIMFFFKDGTKFMTTLTHTIESHAIPTTVITDLQKTISSSIVSKEWSMGRVSNYSYLHFLNIFNGKSFNSLNSHPIFPWLDSSVNWETFIPHITNQNCHTSITTIPSPKPTIREFSKLSATQVCCTLHNYEPFQSLLPYYQAQTMSGKAIRSIDQNSKHGLPSEVYLYPLLCSLDRFYILRMSLESKFLNTELLEWVKRAFPHIKKLTNKKFSYSFESIFSKKTSMVEIHSNVAIGNVISVGEQSVIFIDEEQRTNMFVIGSKLRKIGDNNVYGLVNDSNDGLIEIETTSEKTIIKHKGNSMEIGGYLLCFEDSGKGSVEVIVGNNTGIDWMKVDNDYLFSVMKIEEINKIGNVQIIPKHGVIIFTSNGFYFKTISGNVAYEYNKIPSIFHASASGFSYFIEDSLLHVITMYENHFQCSVDENIISMTTVTCLFLDFIILAKSDEIQTFVFLGDRLLPLTTIPFKNGKIIKVCSNTLEMEDPSNWNFVVCFEKDGVNTFSVYSLQYITLVNQ